jgi:hypothetical protein
VSVLQARRLPLSQYMSFVANASGNRNAKWSVLNVDDVLKVLLLYRSSGDWSDAINESVPLRKRALT